MSKRKKTKDFLEDIGSFEFDDLNVSHTGRLVEENKRLQLDFSRFHDGCGSENVLGRSSDVHDQPRDGEDHLCEDTSSFEEELEETLSSHNKRKFRLLSSWRKEQECLIKAYRRSSYVPHTAFCCNCMSENPDFRCKDCGSYSFFCSKCLVIVHDSKNCFHSPGKLKIFSIENTINF